MIAKTKTRLPFHLPSTKIPNLGVAKFKIYEKLILSLCLTNKNKKRTINKQRRLRVVCYFFFRDNKALKISERAPTASRICCAAHLNTPGDFTLPISLVHQKPKTISYFKIEGFYRRHEIAPLKMSYCAYYDDEAESELI